MEGPQDPPKEREKWIEIGEKCGQRVLYLLLYKSKERIHERESSPRALFEDARASRVNRESSRKRVKENARYKRNSRGCALPPCCGMEAIGQIRIVFFRIVLLLLARDDPLLKRDDDEAMPLRVECCCCAANIIPVYMCF